MPNNFQGAQMVIVIHRTLKLIKCSLLVARAAKIKAVIYSFAHSIVLRFAAQFLNSFDNWNNHELKFDFCDIKQFIYNSKQICSSLILSFPQIIVHLLVRCKFLVVKRRKVSCFTQLLKLNHLVVLFLVLFPFGIESLSARSLDTPNKITSGIIMFTKCIRNEIIKINIIRFQVANEGGECFSKLQICSSCLLPFGFIQAIQNIKPQTNEKAKDASDHHLSFFEIVLAIVVGGFLLKVFIGILRTITDYLEDNFL